MCHKKVAKMIFAVVATSQTRSNCRCFLMRFFNHHQKNQKNSRTNSYDAFRFISTSHDAFWWKLIVYVEMMVNVDEMTNSKVKIIWGCNNGSWSLKDDYKHGLRTPGEEIAFTAQPKINSHSQILRYGRSIFCLPHRPKFSDFFDLCLHWVSVVRDTDCSSYT